MGLLYLLADLALPQSRQRQQHDVLINLIDIHYTARQAQLPTSA